MRSAHYVPILRGKAGEIHAVATVPVSLHGRFTPLVDLPRPDRPSSGEPPALEPYVRRFAAAIGEAWASGPRFYLECASLDGMGTFGDGTHPLHFLLGELIEGRGMRVVPVVGLGRSSAYQYAVADAVRQAGRSLALRLADADFGPGLAVRAAEFVTSLGSAPGATDVIVDLGEVPADAVNTKTMVAAAIVRELTHGEPWRSVMVAGSGIGASAASAPAEAAVRMPRSELAVWRAVDREVPGARVVFGDYGATGAAFTPFDPARMRPPGAKFRYTVEEAYIVLRRRREEGLDGFRAIAQTVRELPEFSGRDFSWGDRYIDDCAEGRSGTSNRSRWVAVATSHHITLVVRQLGRGFSTPDAP